MKKTLSFIRSNPLRMIRNLRTARRKLFFVILPILAIGGPFIFVMLTNPNSALGAWWNNQWQFRKQLSFDNAGSADSNKKVLFEVDTTTLVSEGKMQDDCGDVRFTDGKGNLLKYYLDSENGPCNTSGVSNGGPVKIDDPGDPGAPDGYANQVIRTSTGILYAVINDGGSCEVWKSSDGNSWAEQDSADNPTCRSSSPIVAAIDSNDILHLAYFSSGTSMQYNTFDTVDGGAGDDTFNTAATAYTSPGSPILSELDITLDSNNIPHLVAYETHDPGEIARLVYTNRIGGSWKAAVVIESSTTIRYRLISMTINEDNIPEIAGIRNVSGYKLSAAVGDANNASSFSMFDIDSTIVSTSGIVSSPIAVDSTGNTWIAYIDENGASDYITLVKHNDADAWSTWQSPVTNSNVGTEPSIAINGTDVYVFYEDENDDIVYDMYNGSTWLGETTLHTGTYQDVRTKWSYHNNNQGTVQIDYLFSDGTDISWGSLNMTQSDGTTDFYVLMPSIPAGTNQVYMYYGNPSAPNGTEASQFGVDTFNSGTVTEGTEEIGPNPILYWKFDEQNGTAANDSSAQQNTGSINGATWAGKDMCIEDKCLQFDGSNDLVSRADDGDLDFSAGESFTLSAWVKHPTQSSGQDIILSKYNEAGYKLIMESDGDITCGIDYDSTWSPTDSVTSTSATYDDNQWHHVMCVKDGNTSLTLYVDGISVGTPDTSLTNSTLANSDPFYVGIDADGTSNAWLGFIDDVRVYRHALTTGQIKSVYNTQGSVLGARSQGTLSNGLVGYWKMDESSGNMNDSSSNGNTLTDTNTVAFVGGRYGNGGDFESGSSEYQYSADNASLSITGNLSLSAWIRPESTTTSTGFNVIGKWDGSNESYLLQQYGDEIRLYIDSAGNYIETTSANISTSTWYHITGTYQTSPATARIYINGIEQTTTVSGTIPSSIGDDSGRFHIGAEDSSTTATNFYDGIIDESRLYNRTLSPQEVSQLYSFAPAPVIYYDFEDGIGTTVADKSGNGKTGTLVGGVKFDNGKFGKSAIFDQTDDFISVGTPNLPIYDFTYMAWIKIPDAGTSQYFFSSLESGSLALEFTVRAMSSRRVEVKLNGNNAPAMTTGEIPANTWTHLTIKREGGTVTVYFNGVPDATTGTEATALDFGTCYLVIGTRSTGSGNNCTDSPGNHMGGNMDEVRIYNYARTQQQIIQDMNGGHPVGGSPIASQVGYWNFDEGTGTTAKNKGNIGSSVNGTLTNATWSNDGKLNKAVSFDGNGDYVNVPSSTSFDSTTGTWSGWFKTSMSVASGYPLIMERTDASLQNGIVVFLDETDANISFQIKDSSGNTICSISGYRTGFNDGIWHHWATTFDGTNPAYFYVDGKLSGSCTPSTSWSFASSPIRLGETQASFWTDYNGLIDEVKVYNSVLTADQIKLDYNSGKSIQLGVLGTDASGNPSNSADRAYCPPGDTTSSCAPIGYWDFEEGSGTTAYDKSLTGVNGTLTGGPARTGGKMGKAVELNGWFQYVDMGTNAAYDFTSQDFSVSFWVNPILITNNDAILWRGQYAWVGWYIQFADDLSGARQIRFNTNQILFSSQETRASIETPLNQWSHYTVVRSGANAYIYYNGRPLKRALTGSGGEYVLIGSHVNPTSTSGFYNLMLGQTNGNDGHPQANFDEVKIYNYALSPSQVAWNYNKGKPLAHYKFDECTGATAYDSSGNNLHGTLSIGGSGTTTIGNCTTSATSMRYNGRIGKRNYGLDFDSADDSVTVTNTSSIDLNDGLASAHSFSTWIYADSDGENDLGHIYSKNANSPSQTYLRVAGQSGSNLNIEAGLDLATSDATVSISAPIRTGTWNHIAVTYEDDSDDEISVYVNGVLRGTSSNGSGAPTAESSNLIIGNSASGDRTFDGQIDDFKIFNYALTPQQVNTTMNEGAIRWGPNTGAP